MFIDLHICILVIRGDIHLIDFEIKYKARTLSILLYLCCTRCKYFLTFNFIQMKIKNVLHLLRVLNELIVTTILLLRLLMIVSST